MKPSGPQSMSAGSATIYCYFSGPLSRSGNVGFRERRAFGEEALGLVVNYRVYNAVRYAAETHPCTQATDPSDATRADTVD